jgi:hypothetical protein
MQVFIDSVHFFAVNGLIVGARSRIARKFPPGRRHRP